MSDSALMRIAAGLRVAMKWSDDKPYSPMAWKVQHLEGGEVVQIQGSELGELLSLLDDDDFNNVRFTTSAENPDVLDVELREGQQY